MQSISSIGDFSVSSLSPSPITPSPSPVKKETNSFFSKIKTLISSELEKKNCRSLLRKAGLADEEQIELLTNEAIGSDDTPRKVIGVYKELSSYRFKFEEKNPENGHHRNDLIGIGKDGKIYKQTHIEHFYPKTPSKST